MAKFKFQTGDKVLARDYNHNDWAFSHFSHADGENYICGGWNYEQCIPYNETTKHLCGTSDPYIDPTDFEVGDTVSFRYTENTTWCGEIVGLTGGTIQVSVSGGVYSVYRERLTLVRRGEKKIEAPAEAPAFEFGDVVETIDSCTKGIYSKGEETYDEVLFKGFVTTCTYKKGNLRLIRKGNFND